MEDNLCYACDEHEVEDGYELCDVCFERFGEGDNKIASEFSYDEDLENKDYPLYILFVGVLVFVFALVVFILNAFVESNMLLALTNLFTVPLLVSVGLLLLFLVIKSKKKLGKLINFVLLVLVVKSIVGLPVVGYFSDIRDVARGNYYEVEGEVVETHIDVKIHRGYRNRMSPTYTQRIVLDNEEAFSIIVSGEEDYVFEKGKIYFIEALPYTRDILDYTEK